MLPWKGVGRYVSTFKGKGSSASFLQRKQSCKMKNWSWIPNACNDLDYLWWPFWKSGMCPSCKRHLPSPTPYGAPNFSRTSIMWALAWWHSYFHSLLSKHVSSLGPPNTCKQEFNVQTERQQAPGLTKCSTVSSDAEKKKALLKAWMMCWSALKDPGRLTFSSVGRFFPVKHNSNCMASSEIFQLNPISFNLQNGTMTVLCVVNNFHCKLKFHFTASEASCKI